MFLGTEELQIYNHDVCSRTITKSEGIVQTEKISNRQNQLIKYENSIQEWIWPQRITVSVSWSNKGFLHLQVRSYKTPSEGMQKRSEWTRAENRKIHPSVSSPKVAEDGGEGRAYIWTSLWRCRVLQYAPSSLQLRELPRQKQHLCIPYSPLELLSTYPTPLEHFRHSAFTASGGRAFHSWPAYLAFSNLLPAVLWLDACWRPRSHPCTATFGPDSLSSQHSWSYACQIFSFHCPLPGQTDLAHISIPWSDAFQCVWPSL